MAKTTKSQARTKRERSEFLWGWLFILPTTIGLIVLNIIPIFQTIYQSFFKTGDFGKGNIFIGLQNYQKVFADKEIWQALINTFKYAIVEVPFSIVIALVLAVLLNRKMKGRSIYNVFHVHVNWVSNPKIAVFAVAIIGVWSIIGYNMVLFLSGLQEIPRDYYEAASIDGATGVNAFFNITVPLLSPTIFFVLVTRVIGSLQVFDLIYMVIDKSNPALTKTQSLVYLFYKYAFINKNMGYGATIVVVLLIITMILTVFQMIGQKKWVFYN